MDVGVWVREKLKTTREVLKQEGVAYSGDLPLGSTWAVVVSVCRDSPEEDLDWFCDLEGCGESLFPGSTRVERFRHWAVGWVDHFVAEVVDERGEPTPAAQWLATAAGEDEARGH